LITDYQAKYYAYELSRVGGSGVDRLGRALFDACVDLNPHQIEAALFALQSPLSKGALLADEVGLGKTIEAGLVMCQYWAERKRRILVICPASLRKQWELELLEKFNLPGFVMDAKTFREQERSGSPNPFASPQIIICSMHYASSKADLIKSVPWDLVVIDEAHKLRNAYRQSNQIGQRIREAIKDRKTLLLSATPLQNSLLELYGLASLIDEHIFGELPTFKTLYTGVDGNLNALRNQIQSFCWRTLRSQVAEFISYTERKLITRPFNPSEQEHRLYEAVSSYLQRENCYALPTGQKHLLILLVRKVLSSSPHAVAGTLEIMRNRLIKMREDFRSQASITELILAGQIDEDLLDELLEDQEENIDVDPSQEEEIPEQEPIDLDRLNSEFSELEDYIRWARSLGVDTKTRALTTALEVGFEKMAEMGAARKAVIFTESRRTQAWLKEYLESHGYAGQVLTFNGSNNDDKSGQIYEEWLAKNRDNGRATGSRAIDLRAAILDRFRDQASIMIATEAGAEGLNLQFCSLLINFDLPWNPQRIEQRIGRCHRYGQAHDVVVINFLNERNDADRRVHELLEHKFRLFTGVFGASDEVLGAIESGVDFEKAILKIYQECRTEEEIQAAFDALRDQFEEQIQARMNQTHAMLRAFFDEDVHERLKFNVEGTQEKLDKISRLFWALTRHILASIASFQENPHGFYLDQSPIQDAHPGQYHLITKTGENTPGDYLYRLSHPLGEFTIAQGKSLECPVASITFDITHHPTRVSLIEQLKGKSGWLTLQHLQIDSYGREDYLLFSAIDEDGNNINQETCEKLLLIEFSGDGAPAPVNLSSSIQDRLAADAERHVRATLDVNLEQNHKHFKEEQEKLYQWAEAQVAGAEAELATVKRRIQDAQRRARQATNLQEQHEIEKEISSLQSTQRRMRKEIFRVEDEIEEKRDQLVDALEKRMLQKSTVTPLITIKWTVV